MTRTLLLAASVLAGAVLVATALYALTKELHAVSHQLTSLTREVGLIGADVESVADDVSALTDALTGEEGEEGDDDDSPTDVDVLTPGWTAPSQRSSSSIHSERRSSSTMRRLPVHINAKHAAHHVQ